jgi:hypothetical protein
MCKKPGVSSIPHENAKIESIPLARKVNKTASTYRKLRSGMDI